MFYCEKCLDLSEQPKCPSCKRPLRPAEAGDFCLLTEKELMWAEMICDLLKDHEIDSFSRPVLGAGLSMYFGRSLDRHRIYVPFARYAQAKEILEAFLSE